MKVRIKQDGERVVAVVASDIDGEPFEHMFILDVADLEDLIDEEAEAFVRRRATEEVAKVRRGEHDAYTRAEVTVRRLESRFDDA